MLSLTFEVMGVLVACISFIDYFFAGNQRVMQKWRIQSNISLAGFKLDQNAPGMHEQRKVFAWLPCEFHDSQDHLQFAGDVM